MTGRKRLVEAAWWLVVAGASLEFCAVMLAVNLGAALGHAVRHEWALLLVDLGFAAFFVWRVRQEWLRRIPLRVVLELVAGQPLILDITAGEGLSNEAVRALVDGIEAELERRGWQAA